MPREPDEPGRRKGLEVGDFVCERRAVIVHRDDRIRYSESVAQGEREPAVDPVRGAVLNKPGMRRALNGRSPLWAYGRHRLAKLADVTFNAWRQRVNLARLEEGDIVLVLAYALQARARLSDMLGKDQTREQSARRARAVVRYSSAVLAGETPPAPEKRHAVAGAEQARDLRLRAQCLLASLYLYQVHEGLPASEDGEVSESVDDGAEPALGLSWSEPARVGDELRTFAVVGECVIEALWSEPDAAWRVIAVAWAIDVPLEAPHPLRTGEVDSLAIKITQRRALAVVQRICASRLERLRGEAEGA